MSASQTSGAATDSTRPAFTKVLHRIANSAPAMHESALMLAEYLHFLYKEGLEIIAAANNTGAGDGQQSLSDIVQNIETTSLRTNRDE